MGRTILLLLHPFIPPVLLITCALYGSTSGNRFWIPSHCSLVLASAVGKGERGCREWEIWAMSCQRWEPVHWERIRISGYIPRKLALSSEYRAAGGVGWAGSKIWNLCLQFICIKCAPKTDKRTHTHSTLSDPHPQPSDLIISIVRNTEILP
jgi:hypothetical protein